MKNLKTFDQFINESNKSILEGVARVQTDLDIEDELYDKHQKFFDGPYVDDWSMEEFLTNDLGKAEAYLKKNKIKYTIHVEPNKEQA